MVGRLALLVFLVARARAATSEYSYATGDNLNLALEAQSFAGISDLVTLGRSASPFELSTIKIGEPSSSAKYYRMSSVQNSEDYQASFRVSSETQGSYGAFTASASSKYMQSKTLTSKRSFYFMNFEKQVGTVFLNGDAELTKDAASLLTKAPETFAATYGRYYIHGLTLGCQAIATVTITSKTEFDKKNLDVQGTASYDKMISDSKDFTSHMSSQKGFDALDTEVFTFGGDVPVAISNLSKVQSEVVDAMDTGSGCTRSNAKVTRAVVKSWLSFPAIAAAASQNPDISKALTPSTAIKPSILERLSNVKLLTFTLLSKTLKCHTNVFSCVTKQWNEPTDDRVNLYRGAFSDLLQFRDKLDQTDEASLSDPNLVLSYESSLEATYEKWLKPAEALTPFIFNFKITVLNSWNKYKNPPGSGTYNLQKTFTIDPNHEDTDSEPVTWTETPAIDDGKIACFHWYGNFHAKYQSEKLYVWQSWKRACRPRSGKTLSPVVFQPGGDTEGATGYKYGDGGVRTVYGFTVTYGQAEGREETNATILI